MYISTDIRTRGLRITGRADFATGRAVFARGDILPGKDQSVLELGLANEGSRQANDNIKCNKNIKREN